MTLGAPYVFQEFPKIPRLNRDIVISEKIDGTNAAIIIEEEVDWIAEPGGGSSPIPNGQLKVSAQSRTRVIQPGKQTDNYGFAEWVQRNAETLKLLGPGIHYGEWWGVGIQRGYGLAERRFSLFNAGRWGNEESQDYPVFQEVKRLLPNVDVVPVLYQGPWMAMRVEVNGVYVDGPYPTTYYAPEIVIDLLRRSGSVAAPGYDKPEGIVVYHTAGHLLFKATLERDGQHKGVASGS